MVPHTGKFERCHTPIAIAPHCIRRLERPRHATPRHASASSSSQREMSPFAGKGKVPGTCFSLAAEPHDRSAGIIGGVCRLNCPASNFEKGCEARGLSSLASDSQCLLRLWLCSVDDFPVSCTRSMFDMDSLPSLKYRSTMMDKVVRWHDSAKVDGLCRYATCG